MVAATSSTFGQARIFAFGMAARLVGVSMMEGATALTRMSCLGDFLGERHGERGDRGLARGIGDEPCPAPPFERVPRGDIDDASALAGAARWH